MPLRTDARRNLRHVLSAARDVFGEQGYDAPIEEVARRARVGVGTVYRRFPTKEALVQYIAEEETQRLTDRALEALAREDEPWRALEGFVRYSAASGTSRLLPELLAAAAEGVESPPPAAVAGAVPGAGPAEAGAGRLPRQRGGLPL
ncbi:TetR/AcrR family transcriptional regulator, partial [Streptomyces sp. YIM 98790]|uniref:TetR/AcrR family transcriptional regulator n=1 Tax=Streptomyces sp. YIM 98790 TaxID=2689077 RepID=UPI00140CA190